MLVYIAQLLLSYLVHGPWRDPEGQNFPQSQAVRRCAMLMPLFMDGTRINWGFILRVGAGARAAGFSPQDLCRLRMQVAGLAPAAAAYAGFSSKAHYLDRADA